MITIKFTTGEQMRIEADSAKVLDGILILFVYDKDRTKLQRSLMFRANTIDWARLDNGTVLIGEPDGRFRDIGSLDARPTSSLGMAFEQHLPSSKIWPLRGTTGAK